MTLRNVGIALTVVAALAWLAWRMSGGPAALVAAALPDFPVLPAPLEALDVKAAGKIHFASRTPYDLDVILRDVSVAAPTTGVGTLSLPSNASADAPVPAMILLHGSGGLTPGREDERARIFNAAGYAAFIIDYYTPRGIRPDHDYMLKVLAVTEFDAITDAYAALELLSSHPAIDASRIGLMGFSYGGMAARFGMDERIRTALAPKQPGFAAFIDVYGPCFQVPGTRATNGAPLLTLRGTLDASNDLEACAKREDELRALGVEVVSHIYEGAGHAWENERPRELVEDAPYVAGCEIAYDESGRSSIDGRPIVSVPVETPRPERVVLRMKSGEPMRACVKSGYVIGSDPDTAARADEHTLAFLTQIFAR